VLKYNKNKQLQIKFFEKKNMELKLRFVKVVTEITDIILRIKLFTLIVSFL